MAAASVYYVRTDGSDFNAGTTDTSGGAWRTIGKAAAHPALAAGDTVYVRAGTFQEYVTLTRSGSVTSRINWIGARDGSGNLLTIVDPSELLSSGGWSSAPEMGANVWKRSFTAYRIRSLTSDGYYVPALSYPAGAFNRNFEFNYGPDQRVDAIAWTQQLFWDGKEAMWQHALDNTLYVRYRAGDNPSTKAIRVSSNGTKELRVNTDQTAILIRASYNRVSGFVFRGAAFPVGITTGPGVGDLIGNIIESNLVYQGYSQITLNGGANISSVVASNIVRFNTLTTRGLWETGGHTGGAQAYNRAGESWPNFNIYYTAKQRTYEQFSSSTAGGSGYEPGLITLYDVGNGNVIHNNVLSNGVHGLRLTCDERLALPRTQGTIIASNNAVNLTGGLLINEVASFDNTEVFENQIENAWFGFSRMQSVNRDASGNARIYIYRNRLWNPTDLGSAGYFHYTAGTFQTEAWYYNNSYEGGAVGFTIPTSTSYPLILRKFRFINNILCPASKPFDTFGLQNCTIHHNRIRSAITGTYVGANIVNSTFVWGGATAATPAPDFLISTNSIAWNAGTNVAGLGVPDSRTMSAGAWDVGAHELSLEVEEDDPEVYTSLPDGPEVFERGATVRVRITRTTNFTGLLTGTWSIAGTAENGTHCSTIPGTWAIQPGEQYEDVDVIPMADLERTGDLYFLFTLNPQANYRITGQPSTLWYRDGDRDLTIRSDPPLPGQFRPFRL
jgi:hypothetical protein